MHGYPGRNIKHEGRRVRSAEIGGRGKGGNLEWIIRSHLM